MRYITFYLLLILLLQWGGGTFGKLPTALILLHWFAIDCKPKISPKNRDQGFFPTTLQIKKPKVAYNKPTWQLWLYGVCNSFQVSMWLAQLCAINHNHQSVQLKMGNAVQAGWYATVCVLWNSMYLEGDLLWWIDRIRDNMCLTDLLDHLS